MRYLSTFAFLVLFAISAGAQCLSNANQVLDVNKVEAGFNNSGAIFYNKQLLSTYFAPKANGTSPVFAGGLWIGGLSPQGQLHLAASSYRQQDSEYFSGPMRYPNAYNCDGSVALAAPMFRKGLKQLSNGKLLMLDSLEVVIYDPLTAQSLVRPLPQTRQWMDAVELADGRILLFGDDSYPNKNPVFLLDTVNYNLTVGPTLVWFHKESSATLLLSGKVLLAGVIGCELFDPVNNTSTAVPDMLYARMKHAAVRLPNGDVHAFGGGLTINGTGLTLRTQYFDDSLGYWFPGPDMAIGRNSPAAVLLPNGTVLIAGGSTTDARCELFDPLTNLITPSVVLPKADNIANAVLVSNDKVLMAQYGIIPETWILSLLDLNSMQLEPVRIETMGPQVCLIDSETVAVGYNNSTGMQSVKWRNSLQPNARWQYIWKVSRAEIDQFKADFLANAVDFERYPHIETWPAHGSVSDGEDRNLAPFVDVNMDGLYLPASDGDYPCIVGDQALWWVFNDQGSHLESGGLPMGLQVEAMAYAFDCNQTTCPDTALDYATFLHYEITNHSDTAWSDMFLGQYYDIDLGSLFDDFVGSDSSLNLAFGFNGDNADASYGVAPPAWGSAVLPNGQLPNMSSLMSIENTFGAFNSNPSTPAHYYNYLRAEWLDSTHLVNNGSNGHQGSASGPRTNFMYSSTQGFCGGFLTGWSELTAASVPGDRRFLQSSGPFSLQPGQSIQYDVFYPFARDSSHTQSVCALKDATATIQTWWQNQLDRSCFSIVVGNEPELPKAGFKVIPNPVTGSEFLADFGIALDAAAELDLMDLNGRVVRSMRLNEGADRQLIAVEGLPAGVYLARLRKGTDQIVQRVLIW